MVVSKRALIAAAIAASFLNMAASAQKRPPSTPAPAKTERPVPFTVGELLTYDVSWSNYLTAGTATVTVKEKKPSNGSTAYYVVAEGRPTPLLSKLYNLYYKADTLLDAYTLLPQRGSVYSEEGGRKRMKVTTFDQSARKAVFEMETSTTLRKDLVLPEYTQDALAAIYVLRAVPLKPGGRMTMPVADNGKVLKVQMNVSAPESVKTGIGAVNALRVTPIILDEAGKTDGRAMSLWISDDPRRLPVKLQAQLPVGSFVLTLKTSNR
jgi:hypothetical protein